MPPAFRQLYDDHVRFVWRVLVRLGVPESDVADAVQDVFVVVHRRLPEFEGRSKATTWLFEICVRVVADRRKRAHLRREIPSPCSQLGAQAGDTGDPDAGERGQARKLLDAILDAMPEAQRVVFLLYELDERTAEEIAEIVGAPVGTVRSRLRLAREAFREGVARIQAQDRGVLANLKPAEGWR